MNAYSHTNKFEYLDKAMTADSVSVTCESASTSTRYNNALSWACHAHNSRHGSTLDAFSTAVELLSHAQHGCTATSGGLEIQY